MKWWELEPE